MAVIVSVDELEQYMSGVVFDDDQREAARTVLRGLQRELERYCTRPVERRVRTETVRPDDFGRLWPRATPIVEVLEPSGLVMNHGNGLEGSTSLSLIPLGSYGPVTITYVGGLVDPALVVDPDSDDEVEFDDAAADVKVAILRAAAREMTVRHDDTLSVKDLGANKEVQPSDRRDIGFTDDELKKFDRIRRRTVV